MIRPATADDAAAISRLMAQLGYDVAPEVIADRLQRLVCREVFVALSRERIVGWAAVCADEPFVEGLGAHLEGLVVEESVRSLGIGAALLERVEAWARQRGCTELRVHSNVIRERAHAFYRRRGYTTVKAQYYFSKLL